MRNILLIIVACAVSGSCDFSSDRDGDSEDEKLKQALALVQLLKTEYIKVLRENARLRQEVSFGLRQEIITEAPVEGPTCAIDEPHRRAGAGAPHPTPHAPRNQPGGHADVLQFHFRRRMPDYQDDNYWAKDTPKQFQGQADRARNSIPIYPNYRRNAQDTEPETLNPVLNRRAQHDLTTSTTISDASTKEDITTASSKQDITTASTKQDITTASTKEDITTASTKEDITTASTKEDITTASTKEYITPAGTKEYITTAATKEHITTAGSKDYITTVGNKKDIRIASTEGDTATPTHSLTTAAVRSPNASGVTDISSTTSATSTQTQSPAASTTIRSKLGISKISHTKKSPFQLIAENSLETNTSLYLKTALLKSESSDPILEQVASELMHEWANSDDEQNNLRDRSRTTAKESPKKLFQKSTKRMRTSLRIHLANSSPIPIPLPKNNAYCFFYPKSALCGTPL